MPEIIVHAVAGRTPDQKRGLCADITAAVVKNFGVQPASVIVTIVDTPRDSKMKGGKMYSDA